MNVEQRDIDYAEKMYNNALNRYGKDHPTTRMWRSTVLRLNNRRNKDE